jgi:hypothetical protein
MSHTLAFALITKNKSRRIVRELMAGGRVLKIYDEYPAGNQLLTRAEGFEPEFSTRKALEVGTGRWHCIHGIVAHRSPPGPAMCPRDNWWRELMLQAGASCNSTTGISRASRASDSECLQARCASPSRARRRTDRRNSWLSKKIASSAFQNSKDTTGTDNPTASPQVPKSNLCHPQLKLDFPQQQPRHQTPAHPRF